MATIEATRPISTTAPGGRRLRHIVTGSILPRFVLILGCLVFRPKAFQIGTLVKRMLSQKALKMRARA